MKVLQIARYGSVKGGAESYVRAVCLGLRDAGHDVALAYAFDADDSRPEVREGRALAAITSRADAPTAAERAEVDALIDRYAPDVVHVHNVDAAWLAPLVATRAPVVRAVHDHVLDCPVGTRYWAAWSRACGVHPGPVCLGYNAVAHCGSLRANVTLEPYRNWRRQRGAALRLPILQVFSDYMAGMLERSGFDPSRVSVTPYPVPPMPAPAIVSLGGDGRPVVFATGRLVKEKGFAVLLDAMAHVPMPAQVVIAGRGHHADALRRHAEGVPERHRVRFEGWLAPDVLAGWYAAASLVAVPSAWPEPFGIVGLEAMAAGDAVVATDIGGVRQWLDHGRTGLAVAPRDPRAFGDAIASLLADDARRAAMGAAGRERAAADFSLAGHVATLEELYARARAAWKAAA